MNRIEKFVAEERDHFSDYDDNIFMLALLQVGRYYEFLEIIVPRYEAVGATLRDSFKATFEATQNDSRDTFPDIHSRIYDQAKLRAQVHLEIESFYTFAKILLDKVALFLDRYFGDARGMRLLSHSRLAKHIEAYSQQKKLNISDDLLRQISVLELSVCHYRDKQISHQHNLRTVHGTSWLAAGGGLKISSTTFYPKETDTQRDSDDVSLLFREIERYVDSVLLFASENRSRSALELKN